jgi:hypothetical protein
MLKSFGVRRLLVIVIVGIALCGSAFSLRSPALLSFLRASSRAEITAAIENPLKESHYQPSSLTACAASPAIAGEMLVTDYTNPYSEGTRAVNSEDVTCENGKDYAVSMHVTGCTNTQATPSITITWIDQAQAKLNPALREPGMVTVSLLGGGIKQFACQDGDKLGQTFAEEPTILPAKIFVPYSYAPYPIYLPHPNLHLSA